MSSCSASVVFRTIRTPAAILIGCILAHRPVSAQQVVPPHQPNKVTQLFGLPDIPRNSHGALSVTDATVAFDSPHGEAELRRADIISVTPGSEPGEIWGTTGQLIRMALPYGGGKVAAQIMRKKRNFLTLEYRDEKGAYHGAVFSTDAKTAFVNDVKSLDQNSSEPVESQAELSDHSSLVCEGETSGPAAVRLMRIRVDDSVALPAEDRAMIYEDIVRQLSKNQSVGQVFRDGDRGHAAACAPFSVVVAVQSFKKGSQVTRAFLGPLGMIIAHTSLHYTVSVQDRGGKDILERRLRNLELRDVDSMSITGAVGRSVAKAIKKQHLTEPADKQIANTPQGL
ncbi:hypothetical protein [Acidicapsa ligni]|uniref:hypothetical protein n=1 Tax=Acidicapsa ligni TaxID=542300 RepID=UPI0021DFE843|nr:hypothetical protein [Acidicapsa ligni]